MPKSTKKKNLSRAQKKSIKGKKTLSGRNGKSGGTSSRKAAVANTSKSAKPAAASNQPLVAKLPQSKQQAALQHHMFLHEDDAWSLAYFDSNDLHSVERELFG